METRIHRDSVFQPAEGISWRDITGELIVLQLASGEYFSFNEIGRLTWMALAGQQSIAQIVDEVVAEYDVPFAQAEADVVAFIQGLLGNKLLIPHNSKEGRS